MATGSTPTPTRTQQEDLSMPRIFLALAAVGLLAPAVQAAEVKTFNFFGSAQATCLESTQGIDPGSVIGLPPFSQNTSTSFSRQTQTAYEVSLVVGLDGGTVVQYQGSTMLDGRIRESK